MRVLHLWGFSVLCSVFSAFLEQKQLYSLCSSAPRFLLLNKHPSGPGSCQSTANCVRTVEHRINTGYTVYTAHYFLNRDKMQLRVVCRTADRMHYKWHNLLHTIMTINNDEPVTDIFGICFDI